MRNSPCRISRYGPVVPLALLLVGCAPSQGFTGSGAYTPPTGSPSGSPSAAAFLAAGACAAHDRVGTGGSFHQVSCDDPAAVARVTVRRATGSAASPDCPDTTDFVLSISGTSAAQASAAPDAQGYACLRDLRPPHPGDPGMGGGPNTIVGDCVYTEGPDEAEETACNGSGKHPPQYKVVAVVTGRADCPHATSLYVGVERHKVGCARAL
jgi:hypothetical protein